MTGETLCRIVDAAAPRLLAIGTNDVRPAEDKWSPKEIIGHLIDSAVNNLSRFTVAQIDEGYVVRSYAQNDWVRIGHYQTAPWHEVVALWQLVNHHVARVIDGIPDEMRRRPLQGESPTLAHLVDSYVDHLQHHLRQVLGE